MAVITGQIGEIVAPSMVGATSMTLYDITLAKIKQLPQDVLSLDPTLEKNLSLYDPTLIRRKLDHIS